jgi:hypothetical protein
MRARTRISLGICAVLAAAGAAVVAQNSPVQTHIGHVMDSFPPTPQQQGLLPVAMAEAATAAQHAAFAAKAGENVDAVKLHAGHVLHAVDPSAEPKGPGLGFGVKRAAQGVAQHIDMAAKSEGASANVKTHANHVATAAGSVATRADELAKVATQAKSVTSGAEAAKLAAQMNLLASQLTAGVDANNDGRVNWGDGEGGLQQAQQHMQLMRKGEGQ